MSSNSPSALRALLSRLKDLELSGKLTADDSAHLEELAIQIVGESSNTEAEAESRLGPLDGHHEEDDAASNVAVTNETRKPRSNLGLPRLSEGSSTDSDSMSAPSEEQSVEGDDEDEERTSLQATGARRSARDSQEDDYAEQASEAPETQTDGTHHTRDRSTSLTGIADAERAKQQRYGMRSGPYRRDQDTELETVSEASTAASRNQRSTDAGWGNSVVKRVAFSDQLSHSPEDATCADEGTNADKYNTDDMDAAEDIQTLNYEDVGDADVGEDLLAPKYGVTTVAEIPKRRFVSPSAAPMPAHTAKFMSSDSQDSVLPGSVPETTDKRSVTCASPFSQRNTDSSPMKGFSGSEHGLQRISEQYSEGTDLNSTSRMEELSQTASNRLEPATSTRQGADTSSTVSHASVTNDSVAARSGMQRTEVLSCPSKPASHQSEYANGLEEDIGAPAAFPTAMQLRVAQPRLTPGRPMDVLSITTAHTESKDAALETSSSAAIDGASRVPPQPTYDATDNGGFDGYSETADFNSGGSYHGADPDVIISEQLIADQARERDSGDADLRVSQRTGGYRQTSHSDRHQDGIDNDDIAASMRDERASTHVLMDRTVSRAYSGRQSVLTASTRDSYNDPSVREAIQYVRHARGSFGAQFRHEHVDFSDDEEFGVARASEDLNTPCTMGDEDFEYDDDTRSRGMDVSSGYTAPRHMEDMPPNMLMRLAALRRFGNSVDRATDDDTMPYESVKDHTKTVQEKWAVKRHVTRASASAGVYSSWDAPISYTAQNEGSLALAALYRVAERQSALRDMDSADDAFSNGDASSSHLDFIETADSDVEFDMDELLAIYDAKKRGVPNNRPQTAKPGRARQQRSGAQPVVKHVSLRPGTAHPRRRAEVRNKKPAADSTIKSPQQQQQQQHNPARAKSANIGKVREGGEKPRRLWSASAILPSSTNHGDMNGGSNNSSSNNNAANTSGFLSGGRFSPIGDDECRNRRPTASSREQRAMHGELWP